MTIDIREFDNHIKHTHPCGSFMLAEWERIKKDIAEALHYCETCEWQKGSPACNECGQGNNYRRAQKPDDAVSNDPCFYCIEGTKCKQRTEYFPECFRGRKIT